MIWLLAADDLFLTFKKSFLTSSRFLISVFQKRGIKRGPELVKLMMALT